MNKKILLVFIVIVAVCVLYYVGLLLFSQKTQAPENSNTSPTPVNFKGPTGAPYVKGPTAPPPGE